MYLQYIFAFLENHLKVFEVFKTSLIPFLTRTKSSSEHIFSQQELLNLNFTGRINYTLIICLINEEIIK